MSFSLQHLHQDAFSRFDTVIDVRSPAEFEEDHIPGSRNLYVLSDAQRAQVGTIYSQDSPFRARKIGAALVARNAATHIETALHDKNGGWHPLIYCWRGGQRSGSFASILSQIGWRTDVLDGGYRSYRRQVVNLLHETALEHRFILLDGNTGSGKTAVLHALAGQGAQVLDLEGLAQHRGSVFGATGQAQPSQKMFESRIADALLRFDPSRVVVAEAESSKIGQRIIPASLWKSMCAAPRIEIAATLAARAKFLARDYGSDLEDIGRMSDRLDKLRPYCSHARVDRWQGFLKEAAHEALATELMAHHYDASYARSRKRQVASINKVLHTETLEPSDIARLANEVAALLD